MKNERGWLELEVGGSEPKSLFLDKWISIDRQIRQVIERVGTLEQFLKGENDFIDEAIYPFVSEVKTIVNQALNRLQEVGSENREKILSSPEEQG